MKNQNQAPNRVISNFPMLAVAVILATNSGIVHGQDYPVKPIRLVSAHAAGGAADTLSRIVAEQLGTKLGQPIVVENRPGASTALAAEHVSRAPADGYTILMVTVTTLSINPTIMPKLQYDPIKDFAPITVVASTPFFLGTNVNLPVTSVQDLINMAKQKPGKLNYGSSGNGTSSHLAGELFNDMANIKMVQIPYKATSARNTDLSSGIIQVVFGNDLLPFSETGKVRILGVTSKQRLSGHPEIPTVAEAGNLPGYEASVWYGLVAPAGTPPKIINRLSSTIHDIVVDPMVKKKIMTTIGGEAIGSSPQAFSDLIESDKKKWRAVIKRAGIATAQSQVPPKKGQK
ncbi:tripartite tricarboxylate transporter substrate binding protein [Advenella sp. FME57]|uniref:Bug family tripartite tricarboxylate transporter substrate binding protein n=1 Tax=Advenella sp. FME57 TaxID=2742604 RepID=UPI0018668E29|nr:tripartite tricarboxylate transporter substrate binding protein [Advenella sp. FME57]